ncbi:hypothetical protein [Flavivirga jejuensis]|uniref:Outer membrane protein beta-barrel domain-containing protein n=1 Tax=Flavivirga jejuensis TaxID=870487 RepID=A0ABT8WHD7_9FLAO|nr:hypothetical protein [Flavivirga jejuensis]MDO5972572.1 hypothetical protein [Flavivirga jejuensis]
MSDKKHIDRLFQESFKDFEAIPSDAVWENIEAKLNPEKKKRRVIPIWWRYAGVAALLLLLLTIGGAYFNNNTTPTNEITNTDTENTTSSDLKKDDPNNLYHTKDAVTNTGSNENENLDSEPQIKTNPLSKKIIISKESSIVETPASKNNDESKKGTNLSANRQQNTINKLSNTESNTAVAKSLEEKNDPDNIINQSKNNIVITDNSEEKRDPEKLQNTLKNGTAIASHSEKNNQVIQQNKESLIDKEKAKKIINNTSKNNTAITGIRKENTETVINDTVEENKLSIEEAIDKTKDIIEKEKESNRWSIAPNAAPVYFNTLGKGSSIGGSQFNNNSKSGELNMSYGISTSYAINKRLSIRSGINKVNLGYNTNGAVILQTIGKASSSLTLQNVDAIQTNNNTSNSVQEKVVLVSDESFVSNDTPESLSSSDNISINQDMGYIEIPLEFQYALSDKKLGINFIGGFSSFFLNNNKIFSEANSGEKTLIGKANNINKVSYSANLGLGLNYQISKKIDLNLEPMFKYQINTFNNTSGDFKPFFIGVYTGFAIKF